MSKSYGNAIYLSDGPDAVSAKIDGMLTDPQRTHRHIPGNPDVCPVFATHKVFSDAGVSAWADAGCRSAGIGCRDCKKALKESVLARIAPIARRREALAADPAGVDAILAEGADRARAAGSSTMAAVRTAMGVGA
jgi:tryptophanyl-tRNA synthetase